MAPKVPSVITCDSALTLDRELDVCRDALALTETEDTWDTIGRGIERLIALVQGGACDFPKEMTAAVRALSRPLTTSLNSERSVLSGHAVQFLTVLASNLGVAFQPLLAIFLPVLLGLCARTSKLFVARARTCITNIIDDTRLPTILPYLMDPLKDKSVNLRLAASEAILCCVNSLSPADLAKEARATEVETAIRLTARDASADVRKLSRKVFEAYKAVLPDRVQSFVEPLTPKMRKYLDIKAQPVPIPKPQSTRPPSAQSSGSSRSDTQRPQLSTSTSTHRNAAPARLAAPIQPAEPPRPKSSADAPAVARAVHRVQRTDSAPPAQPRRVPTSSADMPPPQAIPPRRPEPSRSASQAPIQPSTTLSTSTSSRPVRPEYRPEPSSSSTTSGPIRPPIRPLESETRIADHPPRVAARRIEVPAGTRMDSKEKAKEKAATKTETATNGLRGVMPSVRPAGSSTTTASRAAPTTATTRNAMTTSKPASAGHPAPTTATTRNAMTTSKPASAGHPAPTTTTTRNAMTTSKPASAGHPAPTTTTTRNAMTTSKPASAGHPAPRPAAGPSRLVAKTTSKPTERPKPVSATSSKPEPSKMTVPSKRPPPPVAEEVPRKRERTASAKGSSATQATASQLAKQAPPRKFEPTKKAASALPRSRIATAGAKAAGGRAGAATKPAFKPSTTRAKAAAAVPESVPLPPSPGRGPSPALVALPPSPSTSPEPRAEIVVSPADIPIPRTPSPRGTPVEEPTPRVAALAPGPAMDEPMEAQPEEDEGEDKESTPRQPMVVKQHSTPMGPPQTPMRRMGLLAPVGQDAVMQTPISSLFAQIQQDFMFTPAVSVSPPKVRPAPSSAFMFGGGLVVKEPAKEERKLSGALRPPYTFTEGPDGEIYASGDFSVDPMRAYDELDQVDREILGNVGMNHFEA